METFEPVIVAFCCHYCAYTAADMAGSHADCYPANVKIVRVPCSGKVDAIHMLKALEKGADGVLCGRLPGRGLPLQDRQHGQSRAARKFVQQAAGRDRHRAERLEMVTMSAGMGDSLCRNCQSIHGKIPGWDPIPVIAHCQGAAGSTKREAANHKGEREENDYS
jgi:F420-non-reducing hydrogenase iron-sulfur subunit